MTLPILRETADSVRIFEPGTGAEIDLQAAPLEQLADWRHAMRSYEEDAKLAKQAVDREIVARMDRAALWTQREGRYVVTAPSPAPAVEYDADALRDALIEHGLDQDAVDRAVVPVVTFKVSKRGLDALRKLPGLADVIDEHATEIEKPRRVSVKTA